jgi:hypothetical protein
MRIDTLPPEIVGPSAWLGPQASASTKWIHHLTDLELSELERAARSALETHADIATIRRETFVLPTLGPRLTQLHDSLIHGSGFALLRALPVQEWSREVTAAAFYGLGCHLGNPVPQNAKGHVLGHVMDMGLNANDPKVRIYQTHERQTFHTDSCDIVGLVCLQQAKLGGDSALVSSNTIYNVMRRDFVALAAAL